MGEQRGEEGSNVKAGKWRSEAPRSSSVVRGATGETEEEEECKKSWGRREKSWPDMGLCAVLLICLSQAELGRVWAQEHEGKPLFCFIYAQVF